MEETLSKRTCFYQNIPTQHYIDLYITIGGRYTTNNFDFIIHKFNITKEIINFATTYPTTIPSKDSTSTTHSTTISPTHFPSTLPTLSPIINKPTRLPIDPDAPTSMLTTSIATGAVNEPNESMSSRLHPIIRNWMLE